jgi:hypothetical protein
MAAVLVVPMVLVALRPPALLAAGAGAENG